MLSELRRRIPPVDRPGLYGEFLPLMVRNSTKFKRTRDHAAYMHATGSYPSHLRETATKILTQISYLYQRPTSLDGCKGSRKLSDDAIRDLQLESHPMIKTIRQKVSEGYRIELTPNNSNRRGYSKVYMFQWLDYPNSRRGIIVTIEGAIKDGWE